MKLRILLALLVVSAASAIAYRVHSDQHPVAPQSLTRFVPQDALLTIESPDFSALLRQWTNSAESKAWLASANYAVFQNSRLFGRLGDAQTSFTNAAGIPTDIDLLHEVAGKQSVFAWYDIGRLEFLYITRLPAGQLDQSALFQARSTFERRHAGNADFYVRTSGADYGTVAFARVPEASGDLVLLATREDLIANALKLMASASAANSIQQEPWYQDVSATLPAETPAPALHMVLNLDRIAVDPHFRSYWVQRNISWTKQFRAAASDLYLESGRFREERVLLPKSSDQQTASLNLAPLAKMVPASTGVFRVVATHDPAVAITAIQEKLLGLTAPASSSTSEAPTPDVSNPTPGSASDLEVHIDEPPLAAPSASSTGLTGLFEATGIDAVLTMSSAETPAEKQGLWVPIHSAVVLHAAHAADPKVLASALQQQLQSSLTVAQLGIDFESTKQAGETVYALNGPRPLYCALSSTAALGDLILLADDRSMLLDLLHNIPARAPKDQPATTLIAQFNQTTQQTPYSRLMSVVDGTNNQPSAAQPPRQHRQVLILQRLPPRPFFPRTFGRFPTVLLAWDRSELSNASST